ncbi:MAG TPA: S-layer homology domain-containing protein, partial [Sedimentibacter sp.]|nr:S-layer homology domain-containing protein [Sedimentibacter sp.]
DVVVAYADFVGRNQIIVSGVAVNNGNIQADEATILAEFSGNEVGSVKIGKLAIGETKEFMLMAEIDSEMFESNVNDDGSVKAVMELSVHSKTGKGIELSIERYADAQDVEIINNIESFILKSNDAKIREQMSMRIGTEINIEPYITFLDTSDNTRVVFESSNDDVADISASGKLMAKSTGRAVVTAYLMPKINDIVLSQNNFTKVDDFETLAEEAIKTKSFVVNVTRPGSDSNDKDDFGEPIKPDESTDGNNKKTFKDVAEDAWYYDAVSFIAARGITIGTGDGYFNPDAKLTRGQFIVMIMRAYGITPDDNYEDNFADANDTYYTGYLAAAKRLGLSNGVGNNLFAPDNDITRQDMFTLLYRLLKALDKLPKAIETNKLTSFNDVDQIDSWALDAMTLFAESLIIQGSGQKINPKETTNRAQMAQVLYNILK